MYIEVDDCIKCGLCQPYCPMDCIKEGEESMFIVLEDCVECGICERNANCPVNAIKKNYLEMPRAVRKAFSDPFGKHENTELKHMGRGTEEIKTNDVTGIVNSLDRVAVAIEMGRPGIGAYFRDVEIITKALGKCDINYEKNNPLTSYILDKKVGNIEPEILNEKVLSVIIEFACKVADLEDILSTLREVQDDVDTVFSVCVISKVDEDNNSSVEDLLVKNGYKIRSASSKTNVGLGRPLYEDRIKEEN